MPSLEDPTAQDFDLADGLVILSNAGNAPAVEIALQGASTFNSDISYDGMVNLVELGVLNVNYGRKAADADWDPTADVNGDGIVNPAAPARTIAEDITPETVYPVALGPNAVYTPSALDSAGVMVESLHYRSDLDGSAILLAPIVTRPV